MAEQGLTPDQIDASVFRSSKNYLINGRMAVAQRGTSFADPAVSAGTGAYTLDRWQAWAGAGTAFGNQTVSQVELPIADRMAIDGEPQHALRWNQSAAATDGVLRLYQRIEDVHTLSGKKATLSFWAKADSAQVLGTYFTQYFGSGGSASADIQTPIQNANLTTAWQKFSFTFDIITTAARTLDPAWDQHEHFLMLEFILPEDATYSIDITCVQLEEGKVATPFESIQFWRELQMCQRYFCKTYSQGQAPGSVSGLGVLRAFAGGSESGLLGSEGHAWRFPVLMRTTPTITTYNPSTGSTSNPWSSLDGVSNLDDSVTDMCDRGANIGINAVLAANHDYRIHATADAEF